MLYTQAYSRRQMVDLPGFWNFRFDPDQRGESQNWRDYTGCTWYQTIPGHHAQPLEMFSGE